MAEAFRKTPTPIIFLLICFLCPVELSLFVGEFRLPPHRIALLILIPIAASRFLLRADTNLRVYDLLFVAFGVWLLAVYTAHGTGASGFVYGGSLALESTASYLIARAWVRDVATLHQTLKVTLAIIVVAALIALPETFLGRNFTHDLMAQLTGYQHPISVRTRLGLTRAYGTFDHPIHYGTFCAALMAMFWYAERRTITRVKRATFISGATFLGLSSAPILCLLVQGGLIVWERMTRGLASRFWLTMAAGVVAYMVVAALATRSPVAILATGLTLDSSTGFYRLLIWNFGLENVWAHPMFGIGLADWARPHWMVSDTIDSFWLVTAMRSGIPSVVILLLAILSLAIAVNRRGVKNKSALVRGLSRGWLFSLIALCFIATTVHFWNVSVTFFFFFLGLAGALADPRKVRRSRQPAPKLQTEKVAQPAPYTAVLGDALAAR